MNTVIMTTLTHIGVSCTRTQIDYSLLERDSNSIINGPQVRDVLFSWHIECIRVISVRHR